ncbi:hypothetical protein B9H04_07300 [Halorubrum ezzemoulense DSM 17463]|uniref:Uncharacterized protein n=1 Tax=Halorubrum ezzemoulense DSM 17463 TaxID=1121945 RepID=A0A1X4H898_HALEZ|nr:hypothetical protein B9H04_07300 [Halorubrum ezzemoulense DSM 17463]
MPSRSYLSITRIIFGRVLVALRIVSGHGETQALIPLFDAGCEFGTAPFTEGNMDLYLLFGERALADGVGWTIAC